MLDNTERTTALEHKLGYQQNDNDKEEEEESHQILYETYLFPLPEMFHKATMAKHKRAKAEDN